MPLSGKHRSFFDFLVSNPPGWLDCGIAVAGSRSGALGILNCENSDDAEAIRRELSRMWRLANGRRGIKLDAKSPMAAELLSELGPELDSVIFTGADAKALTGLLQIARKHPRNILLEVTAAEQAVVGLEAGVDGLIAKGHEAGGAVGEETTFVLLQRLIAEFHLPVWAHGGIGLHSAAACYVAGAAGVVLDNQLLLTSESSIPAKVRTFLERMEGDETICLGLELGSLYRLVRQPGMTAVEQLQRLEQELTASAHTEQTIEAWRASVRSRVAWSRPETDVWPLGQDAAFAAGLARRFGTVSGIIRGLRASVQQHTKLAAVQAALGPGAPLAQFHRTEYPVLQGPMTRVSDVAPFAEAVAENGGLPFLALALLRGPQVRTLLAETKERLGSRSWGVGILGFVPADLRSEQLEVVREFRPPFAIIAGGRPDQAVGLEREGICAYLHVPAPALLRMFLQDGARGFIFEGRECGGHVGPRTSFVLWETMIEVLLDEIRQGIPGAELRVVFAGGIHDACSSAMVAAMAAPLAEQGVRIGILLGTAYLFTQEAVSTGAIVESFQQEALECRKTVLLESGPGHATRCVETPFHRTFLDYKRRLASERKSTQEIRDALENLNIGRLRVASKGIAHASDGGASQGRYVEVPKETQRLDGMYMIGQVAALRERTCTMRTLHETVSPGSAAFLHQIPIPFADQKPTTAAAPCDVAIVGMSCLLPKAPDVRAFWTNVIEKVHAITEVPSERFNVDLYFDPDRKARDKIYSRWGGFLDDVPFDPIRYGIPPNALRSIDPMQLLSLMVVDRALTDAGYRNQDFPREKTSVILGLSGGLGDLGIGYAVRSALGQFFEHPPDEVMARLPEWTEDSFAGILLNVTAGRVANRFDLGGVNFTVDAACASSLAAVYLAARELTTRTSDMVIVGGVDTVQSPFGYLCFSKSQALSPRGACRTFDASADGIAISEGITMLVLKRLEDAERDGDRIYAVIKGVAGSSDGRGRSMTAPRLEGQISALERAYNQAGIRPGTVGLIEAHGTGTAAGDAAELAALSSVFAADGAAPQSCSIGSVKSMIGHTKSAAGVTGLMKAALALYHKTLPPTLHVEQPNPKLREPGSAFFVNKESQPWMAMTAAEGQATPRRAGVSSFGFGGTNFHAVLEEYQREIADPADRANRNQWPAELFLWSALPDVLADAVNRLAESLKPGTAVALRDLSASICARAAAARDGHLRLAIVASSLDDLRVKLDAVLNALRAGSQKFADPKGIYMAPAGSGGKVAFLFPGQGSQKPGMLRDLALSFPEIRESLERADRVLAGKLPKKLSAYIYPPPAFTPEEERQQSQELTDTVVAQPALGAVETALYALLDRFGVRPDLTAGHSYGEYVALHAAGVFNHEALISLSEARGRTIKESLNGDAGTMAAVAAEAAAVSQALNGTPGVTIANHNAPRQTVISGATEAIHEAVTRLAQAGLTAKLIPVACAFHSPLMGSACDRLAAILSQQSFAKPDVTVYSNALGDRYPEDPGDIATVLAEHLIQPVRFVEQIQAMYEQGARIFVEVGPKGVLTGLVRQILEGKEACLVQLDGERPGLVQLLHALAQLTARGVEVDSSQLFRGRATQILDLDKLTAHETAQTGWLVNGAGAFPRNQRPALNPPIKMPVERTAVPAAPELSPALPAAMPLGSPPTAPVQLPVAGAPGTTDAVMLQFQQLMSQFLQTQAAVMTGYLGASPATALAVPQAVVPQPAAQAIIPAGPLPAPPHAPPETSAVTPASAAPQRNYAAELRKIASDRTGYPAEMLDLNAGIEADLGIDSIKRVEILSAFQRLCSASEQKRVQAVMEALTSARTLGEIANRITVALAEEAAPMPGTPPVSAPLLPPPAPLRDHAAELRKIASERTGYPAEMLDLNAGIEADLGIDSIKRVEILSAFQRLCSASEQKRVQAVMETLTSARTLGEIADRITGALIEASASGAPSSKTEARNETIAGLTRCVLATVERPRRAGNARFYPNRVYLITDDETGIAAGLADELARAGERPLLLRHSPDVAISSDGVFSADLTDPVAVASVAENIRHQYGQIGAVVHLLPLRAREAAAGDIDEFRQSLSLDVKSLYGLARATEADLKQTGVAGGALLAAITARGGDFGIQPNSETPPTHTAIADFLKTLALEFTGVLCRVVDLDPYDPVPILRQKLIDELCSPDDTMQVGLPGDRRLTVVPQLAPLNAPSAQHIESSWVFLLTGGARGITAEIAKLLAKRHRPTLILAGASSLPSNDEPQDTAGISEPARLKAALTARMRASAGIVKPAEVEAACQRLLKNRQILQTLEELRRAGSRVEYHALDVRDSAAFGALIEHIYEKHGRLDVVIHGAGIIEDKLIRDKTPESFDRVFHTKADSAFVLSRRLRAQDLRCLLFMSSISAMFGNRGQADYAAANGVMNGLANVLSAQWHRRVVAMNWGPWDQSGMVSEETRQQFLSRGVQLIPAEAGAEAALREIEAGSRDEVVVGLGRGPWTDVALPARKKSAAQAVGSGG